MKFDGSIDINQPLDVVIAFFADPKYLGKYQEGFIRKELMSGNQGENGAVSRMYYKSGKHEMELTETIISNQLPNTFEAVYHHKHMDNTMKCTFIKLNDHQTRYITEVEYTRINWIMPRLMAILFPNMYKKPAKKWMNNFKLFVERQAV